MFVQGGAIAYAAAVASAYGVRACIVTAAGPNADLSVFKGHELHVVPAARRRSHSSTPTPGGVRASAPLDFIGPLSPNKWLSGSRYLLPSPRHELEQREPPSPVIKQAALVGYIQQEGRYYGARQC